MNFTVNENSWCKEFEKVYKRNFDSFPCLLGYISVLFYKVEFGYICASFSLLIAAISLFGKIKEHYRWFILNQAIWDLLTSYTFTCHNISGVVIYNDRRCYFSTDLRYLNVLSQRFPAAAYPSLLLLSFSRFLCLYYSNFYDKITKGRRIFVIIALYNIIMFIASLESFVEILSTERSLFLVQLAGGNNSTDLPTARKNDFIYKALFTLTETEYVTTTGKPFICLFLSAFATIMIILKISKQFKFQMKNNRKDFVISLRITAVITFQTLLYFISFFLEATYSIRRLITHFSSPKLDIFDYLPTWCGGVHGLCSEEVRSDLIQIRILIESCIILSIMSGYREAIIRFIKFIFTKLGFNFKGRSTSPVVLIQSSAIIQNTQILSHHNVNKNSSIKEKRNLNNL